MMKTACLVLILGCAVATGTACGPGVRYDALKPDTKPARAASEVEIVLVGSTPSCSAEPMGMLASKGMSMFSNGSVGVSMDRMKGLAGKHGLDGVMNVRCAGPGEVGYDESACSGTGFVCN